ncbi:MAG: transporter substrate-binding domain-containing protein [Dehalococcoidia bacterium]|nr:transporter substrate-binding domain-containing protein [Dehalococcoidia bacterium]MYI85676.1 transporter substrate-binding domain-containing protein [Dehalococcoidia bacterium]
MELMWKRGCVRTLVVLSLATLALVATPGCGDGEGPEESTLSVDEYAQECAFALQIRGYAGQTGPAAYGWLAEVISPMLLTEPPPELRNFHATLLRTGVYLLLFLGDITRALDGGYAASDFPWGPVIRLQASDLDREAEALPQGVRESLEEAGCLLWSDELREAATRLGVDPMSEASGRSAQETGEGSPSGDTLGTVLQRGEVKCGVKHTQPLFGFRERDGTVSGLDIEFCKAIAAAVFGDPTRVWYIDASDASTRFDLLTDGEIDVLIRTTAIAASHDLTRGIDFASPILHAGQGFAVRKDSGIESTSDMGDAIICVYFGTRQEQRVADHFTDIGLEYDPQGLGDSPIDAFFSGRCDVLTLDTSDLASLISFRDDATDYVILPQVISIEPLAPVVREGDSEWLDIVNWVVHGLIAAEEMGITRANVESLAANPPNAEVARLLGVPFQGGDVADYGFPDPQFIQRAIAAVGNYGEIYARTVGEYIPRACTLNDLVINNSGCPDGQGGIMYSYPYR